jgi:hypothetical protein
MTSLVQITERRGSVDRVPLGERPKVVELKLEDHQTVVGFEWRRVIFGNRSRKTEDWMWVAYIATRL